MNVLHISYLHFSPRHSDGNDKALLRKINSFDSDIVINTGDNTTDGLEDEYVKARRFCIIRFRREDGLSEKEVLYS